MDALAHQVAQLRYAVHGVGARLDNVVARDLPDIVGRLADIPAAGEEANARALGWDRSHRAHEQALAELAAAVRELSARVGALESPQ